MSIQNATACKERRAPAFSANALVVGARSIDPTSGASDCRPRVRSIDLRCSVVAEVASVNEPDPRRVVVRSAEPVADAADRLDTVRRRSQLLAEAADNDVDDVASAAVAGAPHLCEQVSARDRSSSTITDNRLRKMRTT